VDDNVLTPAVLDYEHQDVTATGTLLCVDPRTGESAPWPGQCVSIQPHVSRSEGVTDEQGRYTVPVRPPVDEYTFNDTVMLYATATVESAEGTTLSEVWTVATASYQTRQVQTTIRLDRTAVTAINGKNVTTSGTVDLSGGAWKPLAGERVPFTDHTHTQWRATTSADGRFTITITAPAPENDGPMTYQLSPSWYERGPYLAHASASVGVNVVDRSLPTWNSFQANEYSEIRVQGWMKSTGSPFPANTRIYLQQSANGKTGRTTPGWVQTTRNADSLSFNL
jgi:hypothetical protein